MPSNQQQIIEQAKFTYSPLVKAFEKQTKTIEDQGEKQIKAVQDKGPIKSIEKFTYEESFEKINNLDKKVDIYHLVI